MATKMINMKICGNMKKCFNTVLILRTLSHLYTFSQSVKFLNIRKEDMKMKKVGIQ